ncbi:MAG: DEAD/DEAH box helicase [Actinomycetia bacterium]|nr:DEAD/DEAH box helicase [Actinomycetes bacterium]
MPAEPQRHSDLFSPATLSWFNKVFSEPTPAQSAGWESIATGAHTLIHAPTGSGKTLAAFLWSIDVMITSPPPPPTERCRVLYVSPMKALAYDIDRNLRAPLAGITAESDMLGLDTPDVSVSMRTGDTPQRERQAMKRHPPDILITTPESLYLMLTSQVREILTHVETVIVDEIHAIAGSKRGTHLALSLERLDEICVSPPQRIGLSATQQPLSAIAEFLGGGTLTDEKWTPRPVAIVDAPRDRILDIEIVVPVPDMTRPDVGVADAAETSTPSIWPAMYPRLVDLVNDHRSTILFVNSRGLSERLAAELNRLADIEIAKAHHGSVSREQRLEIEDQLKKGELRAVVATSTLELGIDMAAVDLVVLVESPSSVATGLQRVGRSGHQVGAISKAKVFPKHRGDLLESAVVVDRMYSASIEATTIPQNPLDVLAQHIVAMVAMEDRDVDELYNLVRRSSPYASLSSDAFTATLDMLAGRYPSDDFAELKPRIVWDRSTGVLTARSNARILAVTNPGTIPDRGLYTVNLPDGARVGELDEEMVYESRPGDTFILGSSTWRISEITNDRVTVTPAPGSSAAKMPFWHGDAPGRPLELGRAVGAFTREIAALGHDEATEILTNRYRLDPWAAGNLVGFLNEEREATGVLPTDRTIVVQRFRDEIGDWRVVLLSPFGGKVHAPWALAVRHRYRNEQGSSVDVIWSDDGILFRFPDTDTPPDLSALSIDPVDVEETLLSEVADSALFTSIFREAAARALLLPRRRPGSRTPLWLQRRKSANLLEATRDFGSFPIRLETYREVLQDHFDLPSLVDLLTDLQKRDVRLVEVDVDRPSAFARSLMFDFIASFMYEWDAPLAEKRAAVLALDRSLLADLLGEPEFRELLDREVVASVEADLQHLSDERLVSTRDAVADLLRDVGPLDAPGIRARCTDPEIVADWLEDLTASGRVFANHGRDGGVYIAAEDAARLRDTIGIQPPPGIASEFLEPVVDPLGDVVSRYARTHGPFTANEASAELGLSAPVISEVLIRLEQQRKVASGAYRPGGTEHEWVSVAVLTLLRRRSLAVLRGQAEAVDASRYAGFLPGWQGIGASRHVPFAEAIHQLRGFVMPASDLESAILPARSDNATIELDRMLASGDIVWIGVEPLGSRDGKLMLVPRDAVPLLSRQTIGERPAEALHAKIVAALTDTGASFFTDIYQAIGGDPVELIDALWDLVWAGAVTNDSFAPVRAFISRRGRRSPRSTRVSLSPPHAQGRWFLVDSLRRTLPTPEERGLAISHMLLDRYGVVTRDGVLAEGIAGGFSGLYPVLSSLEGVGSIRRGYFIEGLGGAQFGLPGAIERLRTSRDTGIVVLASTDPTNPYGGSLPWPPSDGTPQRRAGSTIAMNSGIPVAWLDPAGRSIALFNATATLAVEGIRTLATGRRRCVVARIDGVAARDHSLSELLIDQGFVPGYKGFTLPNTRHSTGAR